MDNTFSYVYFCARCRYSLACHKCEVSHIPPFCQNASMEIGSVQSVPMDFRFRPETGDLPSQQSDPDVLMQAQRVSLADQIVTPVRPYKLWTLLEGYDVDKVILRDRQSLTGTMCCATSVIRPDWAFL